MLPGIYDHFKGGVYWADRVALSAEDGSTEVVVYFSVLHGTWWVRKLSEWNAVVAWPDGQRRPRFVYRGSSLDTVPPPYKVNAT